MARGRRRIGIEDESAWVFNEMAETYAARPPYPSALIDAIFEHLAPAGRRVLDLGAGLGHCSLPLAARGLDVVAVEPARAMCERLRGLAMEHELPLHVEHAAAESLPFGEAAFDLALIVDAMHFLDPERVSRELCRVLTPDGFLVVVTCSLDETPFMTEVKRLLEAASDRRPRETGPAIRHLAALTDVPLAPPREFADAVSVDPKTLEGILRSFSFIGPALAPEPLEALLAQLSALELAPVWARRFTLHGGQRRRRARPWSPRPRRRGGAPVQGSEATVPLVRRALRH